MTTDQSKRRLFLGVSIPDAIRMDIGLACQRLKADGVQAGNWVSPDLYHITLVFMGEIEHADAEKLIPSIENVALKHRPFRLTLSGIGGFRRNRILWMGIAKDVGWLALAQVQADLFRAVEINGPLDVVHRLDRRAYAPHLTLARKMAWDSCHPVSLSGDVMALPFDGPEPSFEVRDVCLFESTRLDGQLVYPVTQRFSLS